MANYTQNTTVTNLGTHTITIPTTDSYSLQGTLTLPADQVPTALQGPGGGAGTGTGGGLPIPSQVLVVINHNGSPIYTSNPGDRGFIVQNINCTAGDTITIVRSSSLAQDQAKEAVKMTLCVLEGMHI